jgi:hypothetical protein
MPPPKARGSLYDVLGVQRSATPEEIRTAYHRAARALHPDVGGSAPAFHRLVIAYQVLSDPERRAEYDRVLAGRAAGDHVAPGPAEWVAGGTAAGPAPPGTGQPQHPPAAPPTFPGVSLAARRRYLAMMALALTLFVLAGTVVRPVSVPGAIAMAAVAMVIPPIAAIVANRPGGPGTAERPPRRVRRSRH